MVALAFFKLVRLPILLLIAVIQYSTRHFIIEPLLRINGYELLMSDQAFAYLVTATVLITAGGYAINDYFDAKIDRINKPNTVVLDRLIKRRVAMALHVVLSTLGMLLGGYLSYAMGMWKMSSLFLFAIFSLWFYSTNLKLQVISGNLLMAVMAGFVPLIVGLFEIPMQNQVHPESVEQLGFSIFNVPAYWVMGFSAFLAGTTLLREITKDVIDMKGDKLYGGQTIPIQWGVKNTKIILIAGYGVLFSALGWAFVKYLSDHTIWVGITAGLIGLGYLLQMPFIYMIKTKAQFLRSAMLNNATILLFVLCTYLFKLSIEAHFGPWN